MHPQRGCPQYAAAYASPLDGRRCPKTAGHSNISLYALLWKNSHDTDKLKNNQARDWGL